MVSSFNIEDLDQVNELGSELNPSFKTLFHLDNLNPNERVYVYKDNNKVIGFLHISLNYETVDILNIIVNKDYRKQSIGSILMDYMISELPENISHILLEVNENNKEAIKLYNKFNFNVINIRKNYYQDGNALIMERKLV